MALFFGVPAVFFVLSVALVLSGLLSPPPNLKAFFENTDVAYFILNGGEALFLLICIGFLLAMKRISFPLVAIYFLIDTLHSLSGKYLESPHTPLALSIVVAINVGVVAYVWNLRRKQLLA